jgi:preprotein translocase subunit SecF
MRFTTIVPPFTKIDFVGKSKYFLALSAILVAATLGTLFSRGLNLGIDFTGGTQVQLRFATEAKIEDVRKLAEQVAGPSAEAVQLGTDGRDFLITARTESEVLGEKALPQKLQSTAGGPDKVQILQTDVVGPRTGSELRTAAMLSLLYSMLLIIAYIWLRFDASFAPGVIVALLHDLVLAFGFYVFTGWEFTITSVAVLLTIAGYSTNDTVVVFDRVRELLREKGKDVPMAGILNEAINHTLSRTFVTSFITFLSLIPIVIFCEGDLEGFALAMIVGVVYGTMSTWFIAGPFMLLSDRWMSRGKRDDRKRTPAGRVAKTTT